MFVVGLTGGIGSGKSTVAAMFAEYGIPIIDADIVAREESLPGTPGYLAIIKHFGQQVLQEDGQLNRAALRNIIFTDQQQRLWLERLLHPLILDNMAAKIKQQNAPYCIAVIALLLEVEFYSFINRILVVDTSEQSQIDRVMIRDKLSQIEIEAILKTQASRANRMAHAQDVILNEGDHTELVSQVQRLHEQYLRMSKDAMNST